MHGAMLGTQRPSRAPRVGGAQPDPTHQRLGTLFTSVKKRQQNTVMWITVFYNDFTKQTLFGTQICYVTYKESPGGTIIGHIPIRSVLLLHTNLGQICQIWALGALVLGKIRFSAF